MMSLVKIPFSASVIWAVHTTLTSPQPPSQIQERVGSSGFEVSIMPIFIKTCFWTVGLAEILVIMANTYPSNSFSKCVMLILARSSPKEIRMSWPFIVAWTCALAGALVRRHCYHVMGEMFTFELSIRKKHHLVTSGPYAIVRHPSYTGGALALFGALASHVSSGSWVIAECSAILSPKWTRVIVDLCWLVAGVLCFLVVGPRLEKEDSMLNRQFGTQWDEWARKVPYRLLPGIY